MMFFIQQICIRLLLGPMDSSGCLGYQGAIRSKTSSRVEMIFQQEETE